MPFGNTKPIVRVAGNVVGPDAQLARSPRILPVTPNGGMPEAPILVTVPVYVPSEAALVLYTSPLVIKMRKLPLVVVEIPATSLLEAPNDGVVA